MTAHAREFVSALTFSALSHRPVYDDLWEPTGEAAARISSWDVGRSAAYCACDRQHHRAAGAGFADDMLTTVALTCPAPLLLVPAMEATCTTIRHPGRSCACWASAAR